MVCPDEGGTGIALRNGTWIGLVGDLYRNVWAGLICSLIACVITGILVDIGNHIKNGGKIRLGKIFEENWWIYFSAMFMESSTRMPERTPGRLILGVCFKDLGRHTEIRPFLWKGGAYENLLKKSQHVEEYRKVWHMIVTHDGLRESKHLYDDENLREVLEGKAVIVSDYTTTLYHAFPNLPPPTCQLEGTTSPRSPHFPQSCRWQSAGL
ncbi:hypothetical protein MRX96_011832 [Rhipicephalus microplus]